MAAAAAPAYSSLVVPESASEDINLAARLLSLGRVSGNPIPKLLKDKSTEEKKQIAARIPKYLKLLAGKLPEYGTRETNPELFKELEILITRTEDIFAEKEDKKERSKHFFKLTNNIGHTAIRYKKNKEEQRKKIRKNAVHVRETLKPTLREINRRTDLRKIVGRMSPPPDVEKKSEDDVRQWMRHLAQSAAAAPAAAPAEEDHEITTCSGLGCAVSGGRKKKSRRKRKRKKRTKRKHHRRGRKTRKNILSIFKEGRGIKKTPRRRGSSNYTQKHKPSPRVRSAFHKSNR
jgi:hypothetical protein